MKKGGGNKYKKFNASTVTVIKIKGITAIWTNRITYRRKKWTGRSYCWRMWTNWALTDDGLALTVKFLRKVEKWRKNAGFYRWSARKTKRHFDPRYEPFDEWHVSCAFDASAACQTSINLTASCSINHPLKILVTVSYKVRTVTTQYSQASS